MDILPPERLVAVTAFADEAGTSNVVGRVPPGVARFPRADVERLVALAPDLVVISQYTDADVQRQLERSGMRLHRMQGLETLAGFRAAVVELGRAVGAEAAAQTLVERYDRTLAELARRLQGAPRPARALLVEPDDRGRRHRDRHPDRVRGRAQRRAGRWACRASRPPARSARSWPTRTWCCSGRWPGVTEALLAHPLLSQLRAVRDGRDRGAADGAAGRAQPLRGRRVLGAGATSCTRSACRARGRDRARGGGAGLRRAGRAPARFRSLLAAAAAGSVWLPLGGLLRLARGGRRPGGTPRRSSTAGETILWTVRLPRVLLAALVGRRPRGGGRHAAVGLPQPDGRRGAAGRGRGRGAGRGARGAPGLGGATCSWRSRSPRSRARWRRSLAVYALAHAGGRASLHGLLLTGLAVSALASAGTSVLLVATEEFRVKTVLFWLAGGLEGRSWTHVQRGRLADRAPASCCSALLARPLDVLSLGEDEAAALGLPVHATRLGLLALAALVAGAATSVAGSVPFVGLMAPARAAPRWWARSAGHLLPGLVPGGSGAGGPGRPGQPHAQRRPWTCRWAR